MAPRESARAKKTRIILSSGLGGHYFIGGGIVAKTILGEIITAID